MPETLYFKEMDDAVYVRAAGHMTAALCADLRSLVFDRMDAEPPVKAVYVDLSACDYMDSTFMGLLVGFNKRLAKYGKKLSVVKPTAPAEDLLRGLGLANLVDVVRDDVPFPSSMVDVVKTKSAGRDLLLKAHENLMEISEENRKKFSTLHSVLKNQAESEE